MAIDPSIALAYRNPEFNYSLIQSPVQQMGQVLTLQNLMQQHQMGQLEYSKALLQWQEMQAISQNFGQIFPGHTPPAAALGTGIAPVAPPGPMVAPVTPAAVTPATPATPIAPAAPLANLAPGQSLSDMMGGAATPLANLAPATGTDTTQGTAQAPPPAPQAQPQAGAPTGSVTAPAQFPIPDYQALQHFAPTTWMQYADLYTKGAKNFYDAQTAQLTYQKGVAEDAARLADKLIANPTEATKMEIIAEGRRKGYFGDQQANQLMSVSPTADVWKEIHAGGMSASQNAENQIAQARLHMDQITKAIELAKAPSELKSAQAAAQEAGIKADVAQQQRDAQIVSNAYALGPQYGQAAVASLPAARQTPFLNLGPNPTPSDIMARGNPEIGKTLPKPESVVTGEAAEAGATKTAEISAELAQYRPVAQAIMDGKVRLQDLSPEMQNKIAPLLIQGDPTGAVTPFGKLISDTERERLGDYDRATTVLQNTLDRINGRVSDWLGTRPTADLMGPMANLLGHRPWEVNAKTLESDLIMQQQQLKKFITNGSLRGLTVETLDKMFPTMGTEPEVARNQIGHMMDIVKAEKNQYLRDLGDKVIPPALKGPSGPGVSGPGQTPGPPRPSPIPGKIHVTDRNGKGWWADPKAIPELKTHGYTVDQ